MSAAINIITDNNTFERSVCLFFVLYFAYVLDILENIRGEIQFGSKRGPTTPTTTTTIKTNKQKTAEFFQFLLMPLGNQNDVFLYKGLYQTFRNKSF